MQNYSASNKVNYMICNQENMTHNEEKYQPVEIDAKLLLKIADNVI